MKKTLALLVVTCLLMAFLVFKSGTFIHVAFASPADMYGNDINYVEVWQWNGASWILKCNISTSGGSYRVDADKPLKFIVSVRFNSTLASSQSEAVEYTSVYMNITYDSSYIWTNQLFENLDVNGPSNGFYWIREYAVWNATGYPQAGVTYACSILYRGYY
ncbi:MAG: hypothetical protein ACKD6O_08140 [Candidatus Bathyarchaeota archaeon]